MSKQPYSWDIFLAHASADLSTAEVLYDLLKPLRVFLDSRCLLPGDDWDQELSLAQSESLITVVLVSSRTDKAYYEREEIAAAIEMAREDKNKHRVVPLFLQDQLTANKNMPYGLRQKNGLWISDTNQLAEGARKLKDLIKQLAQKTGVPRNEVDIPQKQSLRIESILAEAIARLSEEELLDEIVVPLLGVLHPGKIENARSCGKCVRNILSFSSDRLNRAHILFVNIQSIQNLLDYVAFRDLLSDCETVKKSGAKRKNAQRCFPNEVWSIGNQPSIDQPTGIAKKLERLSRENVKFITYEEVCRLLINHLPETASRLSRYSTPEIINLISALSNHTEGRAFGFSADRNINDFYITASLSPHAIRAYAAIKEELLVKDCKIDPFISVRNLLTENESKANDEILRELLRERIIKRESKGILQKYDVKAELSLPSASEIRRLYKQGEGELRVILTLKFKDIFQSLLDNTRISLEQCPSSLEGDISLVKEACEYLELTDRFIRDVSDEFKAIMPRSTSANRSYFTKPSIRIPVRITVPNPERLLS